MYSELFSRNGLSMDRLHALVLLQQKGSLIRAADGDPGRQSQLSRYLTELASYFETKLVEKSGKSLKLTAAGEELALLAVKHFDEIAKFQSRAKNLPKSVVIAAEPHLLASLIVPHIGRIARSVKGIRFELQAHSPEEIIEALQEQKASLGVFARITIPRDLQSSALFEQHYGVIVPERLAPKGGILTWQRVLEECPNALNKSDARLASGLKRITRDFKGDFAPELMCCSQEECVVAVRSGYYASVLPLSVLSALEGIQIQVVEGPELEELGGKIMTAWNKRHLIINPYVAIIHGLLKELLRE
jgi:DNA-binding transcriptional LysR family regulator